MKPSVYRATPLLNITEPLIAHRQPAAIDSSGAVACCDSNDATHAQPVELWQTPLLHSPQHSELQNTAPVEVARSYVAKHARRLTDATRGLQFDSRSVTRPSNDLRCATATPMSKHATGTLGMQEPPPAAERHHGTSYHQYMPMPSHLGSCSIIQGALFNSTLQASAHRRRLGRRPSNQECVPSFFRSRQCVPSFFRSRHPSRSIPRFDTPGHSPSLIKCSSTCSILLHFKPRPPSHPPSHPHLFHPPSLPSPSSPPLTLTCYIPWRPLSAQAFSFPAELPLPPLGTTLLALRPIHNSDQWDRFQRRDDALVTP